MRRVLLALCALLASAAAAPAQDITPPGFKLPPLGPVTAATPAKELFGRKPTPAELETRSIGFYAKGCLAGAVALPVNGQTWQVMRLSRNRNWGNPAMIAFLERFSNEVPDVAGWPGILVGDISQPRGGPMRTGHASHQIGLDADIWLTPMPRRELSTAERETMSAKMMVRGDRLDVSSAWTPGHMAVIRAAAMDPQVQRIFVNPAIKKALCRDAAGDRSWLEKVRPMFGHDYHFHVRLYCPKGATTCTPQDEVPGGEGCRKEDLAWWFSDAVLHPRPPTTPAKPKPPLVMADLPAACRQVLVSP
ncbi:penicillin-insensitive murein endopeptidase [Labrys wisconsinensis]|uniref:Penicillin-insensitive murein endopeptidase n=1 Tax=Labrys wisconsinensis TaxID=425677 RepID=A0ABU0JHJ7_9HYPH|nr:penicillin-insensitive murein endopeptidase [Labrys wisconsinensis]MDQ0473749.1 penicillin-insensitive murein endopeptidase [Labrys wisconsinensis]